MNDRNNGVTVDHSSLAQPPMRGCHLRARRQHGRHDECFSLKNLLTLLLALPLTALCTLVRAIGFRSGGRLVAPAAALASNYWFGARATARWRYPASIHGRRRVVPWACKEPPACVTRLAGRRREMTLATHSTPRRSPSTRMTTAGTLCSPAARGVWCWTMGHQRGTSD
jgi:hypothetical protein